MPLPPYVVPEHVLGVRAAAAGHRRRRDGGLVGRVVEGGDGAAVAVAHGQHAVPGAAVASVAEHLDLVAGVDDDGSGQRLHVGPLAVLEHLEAADLVVLEEQDDAAGVGVRAQAGDEVRARARRVVADLGAEEGLVAAVAGEGALDAAHLEAQDDEDEDGGEGGDGGDDEGGHVRIICAAAVPEHVLGVRAAAAGHRRRRDGGLVGRVVEGGDGAAVAVAHGQHAVPGAAVASVAEHLDLVAGVDDDGSGQRLHVGPLAVLEHLEAADLVVLEEQDDAAGVGVRAQAGDEVRARARRVVADLGAEEGLVAAIAGEGVLDAAGLEAQVLVHGLHDALRQLAQLGAVLAHRLLERRRVGRPLAAVVDVEDVLPVHVVHGRHRLAAPFRRHERLQRAYRLRRPEPGLPEPVALGGHLLHALKKLHRDAMVHQLHEPLAIFFIVSALSAPSSLEKSITGTTIVARLFCLNLKKMKRLMMILDAVTVTAANRVLTSVSH
ncbi:hypothetical protein U9M48_041928 [Paspalum notatum var. saurae]|uniref:Uncharacterized protein n=1 Tax=Paspalum notatum var. saurae TaxID=547442 RepID=A0AAQ3UQ46_PASNO